MDFALNDKHLVESLIALIRKEEDRIISTGIATSNEMNLAAAPVLEAVVDNVGNRSDILVTLADFQYDLSCIKLPEDFEHIRVKAEVDPDPIVVEPEPKSDLAVDAVSDESIILSVLETMAYELGKRGNHDAAYIIERAMRDIDEIKK